MKKYDLRKPMTKLISELLNDYVIVDFSDLVTYENGEYKGSLGDEDLEGFADEYIKNYDNITIRMIERYYVRDVYVGNAETGLDIKKLIEAFQKYNIEYEI